MKTKVKLSPSLSRVWISFILLVGLAGTEFQSRAQDNQLDRTAMLNAVNSERTSRGLTALSWNNWLEAAALRETRDMYLNNFFSHTGSDGSSVSTRVSATGYQWNRVSENIAQGYTSVSEVMTGWMNSPGHRENLLDVGVSEFGAAKIGDYWTQVFASPQGGVLGQGGNIIAAIPEFPETAGKAYHIWAYTVRNYYNSYSLTNLANAWFYYYEGIAYYLDYLERGDSSTGGAYYHLYVAFFNYYYYTDLGYPAYAWFAFFSSQATGYATFYQGLGNGEAARYYYNLYTQYAQSYYAYYRGLGYY